jgi:hypothetical protein
MSTYSVAWNRSWLVWSKRSELPPWAVESILLERTLIEGKPALRIIARLAKILEDELDNPASRDKFWHDARRKLGKLRRLDQRDIEAIETLIAERIPKSSPAYEPTVRPSANPVTGPHQPSALVSTWWLQRWSPQ